MRLNRESGWKCKLPEWGMQPHRIRADKPGRADYPLLMRQCLRTHFDDLSATRSDETGAAAMVRCRCGRSRLRESAACSRDSAQLSARKRGQEEIGSDPILHPMHGTASRTNASDHAAPLAQIRVSSRTVSRHARLLVRLRRYPSVCLPDRHIGTVFRPIFRLQPPKDQWSF